MASTSSHPPRDKPDATVDVGGGGAGKPAPPTAPGSHTELAGLQTRLRAAVKQIPDFPSPGILFEDILPIFQDVKLHEALLRALELRVRSIVGGGTVDVVIGLEARGFLFGPSLALRIGASFVPVRKRGKLPGSTLSASYTKEYGDDGFEMQEGAVKRGQRVLIVDDLIATGGSAAAAGELVTQAGGSLLGYLFLIELEGLDGRKKLGDVPVHALLESQ